MTNFKIAFLILVLFALFSCKKEKSEYEQNFEPTTVIVKTKGYYTINKVFEFINSFDHTVDWITLTVYNSNMPSDSLLYILDYLNSKVYTNDGNARYVSGYLHYQTKQITIFAELFQIKNRDFQTDWLQSMEKLKLVEQTDKETSGNVIIFHVPIGEEKLWVEKFKKYDFVKWAELNYIGMIEPQ